VLSELTLLLEDTTSYCCGVKDLYLYLYLSVGWRGLRTRFI